MFEGILQGEGRVN